MNFLIYFAFSALVTCISCYSMDDMSSDAEEREAKGAKQARYALYISEDQARALNSRADVLVHELKDSLGSFEVIRGIITTRARAAVELKTSDGFKRASELAVYGSGITTLTSMANLIIHNLIAREYEKQSVVQSVSLAIIGSAAFRDQLNIFIDLLSRNESTKDINTEKIKKVSKEISKITSNIPSSASEGKSKS